MFGLRKLRFADLGTGLSMVIGTAGLLAASALHAADPGCACSSAPAVCNDQIFADAAERLKNLNSCVSGCAPACSTSPDSCVPAAPACGDGAGGGSDDAPWGLTDIFDDDCGKNHLKDNGWKLGGNLVQSYTANFNGRGNGYNGPVTWTDQANQYQLNQFWLYAEKVTDTSKKDWDWGARGDISYGTSSRLFTESGLEEPRLNSSTGTYGLAIPQFYFDVAYKKLKIRAGHFISPIGYFTVDTTQNFFSTIPYTYQWGEPFTHTGIMAYYQFTDNFVVSSGVTRGWDNFDNHNPNLGYLGTWAYTFPDKSNLAQVVVWSHEPNQNSAVIPNTGNPFSQRYYQSLVYTKPIDDNWTYVGQSDFGTQTDAIAATGQRANWYGVNQYIYRKINDKWTWGFNFEWWRDEEGYRVAGFLPGGPYSGNMAASGITGNNAGVPFAALPGNYQGNFYQVTAGPRWYPTGKPNLFLRPNLRYDWYGGARGAPNTAGNPSLPFGNGDKYSQALFVIDLCWLY